MNLFLAPHNDDETLFGAFTIMGAQCHVVVVFDSAIQKLRGLPVTIEQRRAETDAALCILQDAMHRTFLEVLDTHAELAETVMRRVLTDDYHRIYAPAIEEGGHAHHNLIGEIADRIWPGKVTHYLTYTTAGKSTNGSVIGVEGEWIGRKLRALACYRSQFENPGTGCSAHFLNDLWEYYEDSKR